MIGKVAAERLAGERWFAAKGREVDRIETVDAVAAGDGTLAIVDVRFADGATERYALPEGRRLWGPLLARLTDGPIGGFRFSGAGRGGPLDGAEHALERDQSNSSYVLGGDVLVKCYRRLWPGVHPEVELVTFLGERFTGVPAALGSLHHVDGSGREWAVALVQEYVPEAEDGWGWCRALVEDVRQGAAVDPSWAGSVGVLTAELHGALAELGTRTACAEELGVRRRAAEREVDRVAGLTGGATADGLREQLACFERPHWMPHLSRVHGDYHVGQILLSQVGYRVIDFEGEPTRSLEERRALDSPLRDVASMLRSIDHVPLWVLRDRRGNGELAGHWAAACRASFLQAYAENQPVSATTSEHVLDHSLLRALEAEKAAYEFAYAESFLPEWLPIAAAGAELLLSREVGE